MNIVDIIQRRRSIFPAMYSSGTIDKRLIEEVLEAANWAPTHKLLQPWRFTVCQGDAINRLAQHVGELYTKLTPPEKYSDTAKEKQMSNVLQSNCVIILGRHRDPSETLPEWEDTASLAMAVQNMWLTCSANNIGCYWGTSGAALNSGTFAEFDDQTKCFGFFYMGVPKENIQLPGKRSPIEDKVKWL